MADNAKKEYDGSDQTVGRGVGKASTEVGSDSRSPEAPAETISVRRLNRLKSNGPLRKEIAGNEGRLRPSIISTLGKITIRGRDRGDAGHDHQQAKQQQQKPERSFVQMAQQPIEGRPDHRALGATSSSRSSESMCVGQPESAKARFSPAAGVRPSSQCTARQADRKRPRPTRGGLGSASTARRVVGNPGFQRLI